MTARYNSSDNTLKEISQMENDEWTEIFERGVRLLISKSGKVRGFRKSGSFRSGKQTIIEVLFNQMIQTGYYVVSIKNKRIKVHRLVAKAFIPNPENKPMINHKNGIKTDNRVENLEWCTNSENMIHMYNVLNKKRDSSRWAGEKSGKAKLREKDIHELYEHIKSGNTIASFARMKQVSERTVGSVVRGETWRHINLDWAELKQKYTITRKQ